MRQGLVALAPAVLIASGLLTVACSASRRNNVFDTSTDGGGSEGGLGFTPTETPCEGLECKQVKCDDPGDVTTLTGKVYDPAGSAPLYNVIVYIPSGTDPDADLPPFKDSTVEGISCEPCSAIVLNPLLSTLTNEAGEFELKNVPVDKDVPVVIQIGKWRRKFHVDISKKCKENKVPNKEFSLPKNGSEGDMPHIAVATGGADALECLLRGIGIDDSEFVAGHDSSGHVHVFNGQSGRFTGAPTAQDELWTDAEKMKKFDLALLSCEGGEYVENKGDAAAMPAYLNAGGRVFATHYHYTWFGNSSSDELRNIGTFQDSVSAANGLHDVNMTFARGESFAKWLEGVGSSPLGKIDLNNMRDSVVSIQEPAIAWITSPQDGDTPRYFSFNTPVGAAAEEQCGRAVFSDLHITGSAGPPKINGCTISSGGLNEQQRALEFFLFDLSACVSDDKVPPEPPK